MAQAGTIDILTIRVFYGGHGSVNGDLVSKAIRKGIRAHMDTIQSKGIKSVVIERMGCESIRLSKWTIEQYTDWLAGGHIYFIVAHPVQGISNKQIPSKTSNNDSQWRAWDLSQLSDMDILWRKLKDNIGYPRGSQLRCGAFLQDKLSYKRILWNAGRLCTPFLELKRTLNGKLTQDTKRELFRFCRANFELPRTIGQRIGWVLKSSFTTNSTGIIFCYSVYQVVAAFRIFCNKKALAGVPSFLLSPNTETDKK